MSRSARLFDFKPCCRGAENGHDLVAYDPRTVRRKTDGYYVQTQLRRVPLVLGRKADHQHREQRYDLHLVRARGLS